MLVLAGLAATADAAMREVVEQLPVAVTAVTTGAFIICLPA